MFGNNARPENRADSAPREQKEGSYSVHNDTSEIAPEHDPIEVIELEMLREDSRYTPDQIEVLSNLLISIDVLKDQIKKAEKLPNFDRKTFELELEALEKELYKVDTINTNDSLETPDKSLSEIKENLNEKSKTYGALEKIRSTTRAISNNQEKPTNTSQVEIRVLKDKLKEEIETMINASAIPQGEKEQLLSSVGQAVKEVTKKGTDTKLDMFQKVMVWFNVKVLKKDYKWLGGYLKKTAFKDQPKNEQEIKAQEYIKENYEGVYKDAMKKGIVKEKVKAPEPLAKPKTTEPLATATTPKERHVVKPEVPQKKLTVSKPEAEVVAPQQEKKSVYYRELKEDGSVESVLKAIEKGPEGEVNPMINAQEKINRFLNEIVEDERQTKPEEKVKLVTQDLMHRVLNQDMQLDYENIDSYYDRILQRVDQSDEKLVYKIKEEIRVNKGTISTLIEQRQYQCNTLIEIVENARAKVKKTNPENLSDDQFEAEVSKEVASQLIDTVADYYIGLGLVSEEDSKSYKEKMQFFVEKGIINVDFATDKSGGGYPLITTTDYIVDKKVAQSAKSILNELSGGKPVKDDSGLAEGYQFTVSNPEYNEEKGAFKNNSLHFISVALDDNGRDPRDIIRHEYIHAVNAAKKDASLAALQTRITGLATHNRTFKTLLEKTATSEPDLTAAVQEYLFGSNQEDPFGNITNHKIAKLLRESLETYTSSSVDTLKDNTETRSIGNYLQLLDRRRDFYNDKVENGWGRPLDEIAAKAGDVTEKVTLAEININNLDINDEMHRTSLGLLRLVNYYVELGKGEELKEERRIQCRDRQAFLGKYFGTGLGSEKEGASAEKIITALVEAANADPSSSEYRSDIAMLKAIVLEDLKLINNSELDTEQIAEQGKLLTDSYVAFMRMATGTEAAFSISEDDELLLNTELQNLLKTNLSKIDRDAIIHKIRTAFPNFDLPYLNILDAQSAFLINYFVSPPERDEMGNYQDFSNDPADKYRNSSHPKPPIRHAVTNATNAYLYGHRKKGTYMGAKGMGDKVDLGFRVNHPKDLGPRMFRWGGIDRKLWVDSFGFGTDEFRTDSNDGLEGLYFATGLPFHKMPFLQNLDAYWDGKLPGPLSKLDKKAFSPDSIMAPDIAAYSTGVVQDIFKRLSAERYYDPQGLVRMVVELGGFKYDAQGQPHEDRTTYSTETDTYRLNTELAEFLRINEIGGQNDTDRNRIIARLQTDRMLNKEGQMVNVIFQDGKIINSEDPSDEIQDSEIKIGQITEGILQEIREIMVYGDNSKAKEPLWKLGLDMKAYSKKMKEPIENIERWNRLEKIGNLMMTIDAKRRKEGKGNYTITDLILEIERAQNVPAGDLRNADGTTNEKMKQRYLNQQMTIGVPGRDLGSDSGEYTVSVADAKDFIKEFSLARSQKVLSIGVWEKGPKIKYDEHNHKKVEMNTDVITNFMNEADSIIDTDDGKFLIKGNDVKYFTYDERGRPQLIDVEGTEYTYRKDQKLSFFFRQTGITMYIDPVNPLPPEILNRYYGELSEYEVIDPKTKRPLTVRGRKEYSTEQGQMFDDVYDTLTKIQQGKELSYKFSVKLYSTDKYRDMSKVHMEFYNGLLNIESGLRKTVLAMTVLGTLIPSVAFLANPYLMLGTLAWALLGQPFLVRAANGWKNRMMAAIEAADAMMGASSMYYKLADESNPPSYGELDLAKSQFESVKFKYRSVLKDFNDGAKWNTNEVTKAFSSLWDKLTK